MIPSESNPFARAVAARSDEGAASRAAKTGLGVLLTLVLLACLGLALYLFFALLFRSVAHGDYLALIAAVLVGAMTYVMARGRRR